MTPALADLVQHLARLTVARMLDAPAGEPSPNQNGAESGQEQRRRGSERDEHTPTDRRTAA